MGNVAGKVVSGRSLGMGVVLAVLLAAGCSSSTTTSVEDRSDAASGAGGASSDGGSSDGGASHEGGAAAGGSSSTDGGAATGGDATGGGGAATGGDATGGGGAGAGGDGTGGVGGDGSGGGGGGSAGAPECTASSPTTCESGMQTTCDDGNWVTAACSGTCWDDRCVVNTVAEPGLIACDAEEGVYCDSSTERCVYYFSGGATCEPKGGGSPGDTRMECDGPGDCAAGEECCRGDYSLCTAHCETAGTCGLTTCANGNPDLVVCDPDNPFCSGGRTCQKMEDWVTGGDRYGCQF